MIFDLLILTQSQAFVKTMIQIGIIENTQHFLYQIEKYQLAVFFFILTVFIYLNPDF